MPLRTKTVSRKPNVPKKISENHIRGRCCSFCLERRIISCISGSHAFQPWAENRHAKNPGLSLLLSSFRALLHSHCIACRKQASKKTGPMPSLLARLLLPPRTASTRCLLRFAIAPVTPSCQGTDTTTKIEAAIDTHPRQKQHSIS